MSIRDYFSHNARHTGADKGTTAEQGVPFALHAPETAQVKEAITGARRADFERRMAAAEAGADVVVTEHALPERSLLTEAEAVVAVVPDSDPWRGAR